MTLTVIGRPAVVGEHEFRDPEVARADDAPHREPLRVRLRDSRGLDVAPAPDALARLRILEHRVVSINSCSNSKSFASDAAQWASNAARIPRHHFRPSLVSSAHPNVQTSTSVTTVAPSAGRKALTDRPHHVASRPNTAKRRSAVAPNCAHTPRPFLDDLHEAVVRRIFESFRCESFLQPGRRSVDRRP